MQEFFFQNDSVLHWLEDADKGEPDRPSEQLAANLVLVEGGYKWFTDVFWTTSLTVSLV